MTADIVLIIIYAGIVFHSVLAAITARKGGDFRGGFQRLNVTIAAFAFLIVYRLSFVALTNSIPEDNWILRVGTALFLLFIVIINHILVVIGHRKMLKDKTNERTRTNSYTI